MRPPVAVIAALDPDRLLALEHQLDRLGLIVHTSDSIASVLRRVRWRHVDLLVVTPGILTNASRPELRRLDERARRIPTVLILSASPEPPGAELLPFARCVSELQLASVVTDLLDHLGRRDASASWPQPGAECHQQRPDQNRSEANDREEHHHRGPP